MWFGLAFILLIKFIYYKNEMNSHCKGVKLSHLLATLRRILLILCCVMYKIQIQIFQGFSHKFTKLDALQPILDNLMVNQLRSVNEKRIS